MNVTAVILNWNQATRTEAAARSVAPDVDRVVLVDNASRREDRSRLATFASANDLTLVQSHENLGYAGGNNLGIAHALAAGCDAVLVLNNDAVAQPGAVALLVRRLEQVAGVGVVMPAVTRMADGEVLHVACELDARTGRPRWLDRGRSLATVGGEPRGTGYVSGEAFLARTDVFEHCGLFDERFFCYFEDAEWSMRVRRAGWQLEAVPAAVFCHEVGSSGTGRTVSYYQARNRLLFLRVGLRKSRLSAIGLSLRPQAVTLAALLRRRQLAALAASLAGWTAGVKLVFQEA